MKVSLFLSSGEKAREYVNVILYPLPLPDGVEDALEGLRLQHDVLDKVVGEVGKVYLADALGELHLDQGWKRALRCY